MEQSIGELERAILENRIRLERLTSETTRRSRAPHLPDVASVLRTVYPGRGQNEPPAATPTLQINGRPGFLTRSPAKLPRYSGLTPLEPYLAQVDLAALHDGWRREETATHLALALEGPALQVLIDLSPEERRDLQALTAALNRRFGQGTSAEQSREGACGCIRHWHPGLRPEGIPYLPGSSEGRAEPPCFPAGPYTWATPPACPPVVTPRSKWGAERGCASWGGATGLANHRSISATATADESNRTGGRRDPAWGRRRSAGSNQRWTLYGGPD